MLRPLPTLVPRVLLGNDYGQKDSGKKFALSTNNTNQFFFFSYSMALILKSSLLNVMRYPTILGLLFIYFFLSPTHLFVIESLSCEYIYISRNVASSTSTTRSAKTWSPWRKEFRYRASHETERVF